jgi:hypothetical protein
MMNWQPIDTAPKDGTDILVACGPNDDPMFGVAYWDKGVWRLWWDVGPTRWGDKNRPHTWPTLWAPLPPLPEQAP